MRGVFYGWSPTHGQLLPGPQSYVPVEDVNNSGRSRASGHALGGPTSPDYPRPDPPFGADCWLHIRLYYCDVLVKEVTTRTAEGCRITSSTVPADSEHLYGPSCMEQIKFPPPQVLSGHGHVSCMTDVLERLLPHLERGVLLWVAPEGVFMKRQCQGRVYWNGPLAPHRNWPNKLEREKTYKLLDTQQYIQRESLETLLPSGRGAGPALVWLTGAVGTPCPLTGFLSCRGAGVPEQWAAHATVPDLPVLRGGISHQSWAPLPEAHHGSCEYPVGLASPEPGTGAIAMWGHGPVPILCRSVPLQVEPVFARELFHHAQRLRPTLLCNSPQPCAPGTSSHVFHVLKQLCQP